jgi:hypothetical protein
MKALLNSLIGIACLLGAVTLWEYRGADSALWFILAAVLALVKKAYAPVPLLECSHPILSGETHFISPTEPYAVSRDGAQKYCYRCLDRSTREIDAVLKDNEAFLNKMNEEKRARILEWTSLSEPEKRAREAEFLAERARNLATWCTQGTDGVWRRIDDGTEVVSDLRREGNASKAALVPAPSSALTRTGSQAPARLGDLLIKEKVITPEQLEQATKLQKDSHTRLESALVKMGFLSDEDVTNFLSRQYGVPAISLSHLEIDPAVVELIPYETAKRHQILPLSRVGPSLTIAMVNPTNVFTTDEIKFMTGFNIEPVVASESSIIEGIDKAYGTSKDGTRKVERVDLADGQKADGLA